MELISDGLLFLTALTTGIYCLVLARRLRRLNTADDGIGAKIDALSSAIQETRSALSETQGRIEQLRKDARASGERMARETARAKRLADDLTSAAAEAERTLDQLYRADERIGTAVGAENREPPENDFEIVDAPDGRVGPPPSPEPARAVPRSDWNGDDVLRVERMSL